MSWSRKEIEEELEKDPRWEAYRLRKELPLAHALTKEELKYHCWVLCAMVVNWHKSGNRASVS